VKPERRTIISYDGHRWEVTDDRGKFLLISRGRGAYEHWIHYTLAEKTK
jgi:hypothetical protein